MWVGHIHRKDDRTPAMREIDVRRDDAQTFGPACHEDEIEPGLRSAMATARPIPSDAPVTSATGP